MGVGLSDGTFYADEGAYIASTMPLGGSTEPADALKQQGSYPPSGRSAWDKLTGSDGGERYQLWPEKVVRSAIDAFKLPGDVYGGKITPEDPEYINRTTDLAGLMVFGPAPVAKSLAEGTLGSFVGVKSKTFDKARLQRAQEMESQGYHRDEIWRETQTMRGFEGRWRQEISDKEMKFHDKMWEFGKDYKLPEILDHPELYKAYPELKGVNFNVNPELPYIASYNSATDTITVNPRRARSRDNLLDVVTHEVQHKIQTAEGFERGTNPVVAFGEAMDALKAKMNDPNTKGRDLREATALWLEMTFNKERMSDFLYRSYPGEVEANLSAASRQLSDKTRANFSPDYRQRYLEGTVNPLTGQTYVPASKYGVEAAKQ